MAMNGWRRLCCWVLLFGSGCCLYGGTLAQFRTPFGDLDVELYDQQKPVTVNNFKRLVQAGAYQNTFFHRLVPGFVAQGGGYFAWNAASTNYFGPNWANLGQVPSFGPITNEYSVGPVLSNTNGTLAMAKLGGNPNSATCEWFFNLANNSTNLDNQNGGFTVFGHVLSDPSRVLAFFNTLAYGYGIQNMSWWYPNDLLATNVFTSLPVTYPGFFQPFYSDLVYVDISFLSVQITQSGTQRLISWNSINGRSNLVEFTTNLPPVWQALANTNGNGARLSIADATPTNKFRFYRVRVLY
jgi:cyclophilin family peptidyl-prolyl cis-trans isomerase